MSNHKPQFSKGDKVVPERSASIPTATVGKVFMDDDGVHWYRLNWSTGNTNEKRAAEIDRMAVNTDE